MDRYLQISELLKDQYHTNLDTWIDNIYYKNAARLYPRVKEVLSGMGYALE